MKWGSAMEKPAVLAKPSTQTASTQQPVRVLCSGRSEDGEGASQESVGQAGWPGGRAAALRAESSQAPPLQAPGPAAQAPCASLPRTVSSCERVSTAKSSFMALTRPLSNI